ncbi:MAG: type III pantothenate kinase [Rickettsiales bacterium]|jgi:type III pantothenate kinase
MLLTIDIGNTNIHLGIFLKNTLIYESRFVTDDKWDYLFFKIEIEKFLDNNNLSKKDISGIIIASVVPNIDNKILKACSKINKKTTLLKNKELEKIIKIDLKNKEEVGVDRLVNAIYANDKYGPNLIIIDFGTATNFDIVGNNLEYLGGIIAPGINLSLKALSDFAAKLPSITPSKQKNVIGKTTKEAMNSGIYFGYISLINGLNKRIMDEHGEEMKIIATGGLAEIFADEISGLKKIEKNLTLEGLNLVYQNLDNSKLINYDAK